MPDEIIKEVKLYDVECRHRITVPDRYGSGKFILIFIDNKANTYFWVTGSPGPFIEGSIYDIRAKLDIRNNKLSFVKDITSHAKDAGVSEQAAKPDAEDILLGLATY